MGVSKGSLCSCIYCKKELSSRGIFCHVDRVHLGKTQYSSGHNGKYNDQEYKDKIKEKSKERWEKLLGKNTEYEVTCTFCGDIHTVVEHEHQFPKKSKYFCSKTCASLYSLSFYWTAEKKIEVEDDPNFGFKNKEHFERSLKLRGFTRVPEIEYICEHCDKPFTSTTDCKYCSYDCYRKFRRRYMNAFVIYKQEAAFNFNFGDFDGEFDLALIKKYGWYSPSNRRNNLNGISRDHMVSVKYGFDKNINPKIIGHPANCKLMKHTENSSKHTKCSITMDQLLEQIEEWNIKYHRSVVT